jgi:hypothetical protein
MIYRPPAVSAAEPLRSSRKEREDQELLTTDERMHFDFGFSIVDFGFRLPPSAFRLSFRYPLHCSLPRSGRAKKYYCEFTALALNNTVCMNVLGPSHPQFHAKNGGVLNRIEQD